MAVAKHAKLVAVRSFGTDTRLLSLEMPPGESLGFRGGQYVIVDAGIRQANGKALKRAYSVVSCDARQDRFDLAVRRIDAGLGSGYMLGIELGAEVQFSGPWGKFYSADGQSAGRTLLVATDTGITSALGWTSSTAHRRHLDRTQVIWFVAAPDYFLPAMELQAMLAIPPRSLRIEIIGPVGVPGRAWTVQRVAGECIAAGRPDEVYLVGDGAAILPLRDSLIGDGLAEQHVKVECYFNHPVKKSL